MKRVVICDANILIDYAKANKNIIGLVTKHLYESCISGGGGGESDRKGL